MRNWLFQRCPFRPPDGNAEKKFSRPDPDIIDNPQDQAILSGRFFQIQPLTLILKTKHDAEKMAVINQLAQEIRPSNMNPQWTDTTNSFQETHENSDKEDQALAGGENTTGPARAAAKCKLHLVPNSLFNLELGRCKVMLLRPTSQQTCLSETGRLMLLYSVFPLDYPAANPGKHPKQLLTNYQFLIQILMSTGHWSIVDSFGEMETWSGFGARVGCFGWH